MAWATRYYGKLASADGYAYQAWLLDESGEDPEQVVLTDAPASVTWGRRGADVYTPVLASHAAVRNWRLASAPTGYGTGALTALIGSKVGDWRLEIRRGASHAAIEADGGTLYWKGVVKSDIYEDATTDDPHEVDVEAVDGLGFLQDLPYYDTTTTPGERLPYAGYASLLEVLRKALGRVGYDLPLRSAIAWGWDGLAGDALAETYVDQAAFYSPDGVAMTCYDVAREVALRLGARLCLWCEDGDELAWWLVSRELMDGDAYTVYKYDATGAADGTASAGAGVDADAAFRVSGRRTFRPAWGAVGVVHEHGLVPPLVSEGTFSTAREEERVRLVGKFTVTIPPVFESEEWAYVGDAGADASDERAVAQSGSDVAAEANYVHTIDAVFHGGSRTPGVILRNVVEGRDYFDDDDFYATTGPHYAERTGRGVAEGQVLAFTGRVRNTQGPEDPPSQGLFNTYWELRLGDTSTGYYLQRDGTWADASLADAVGRAQFLVQPGAEDRDRGMALLQWVEFAFASEPVPAGAAGMAVTLRLYGSSDRGGSLVAQQAVGRTEWDAVRVVVATAEGAPLEATRTEAFVVDADGYPLPEPARPEDVRVRLGEGPAQGLPSRLSEMVDAGPVLGTIPLPVGDWSSGLLAGPLALDRLHAETLLRSQAAPLAARHETYRGLAASPIAPITTGGASYVPGCLTLDLYHGGVEGEWVAWAWDAAATVVSEGGTAGGGRVWSPAPQGGAATGVSVPYWDCPGAYTTDPEGEGTVVEPDAGGAVTLGPIYAYDGRAEAALALTSARVIAVDGGLISPRPMPWLYTSASSEAHGTGVRLGVTMTVYLEAMVNDLGGAVYTFEVVARDANGAVIVCTFPLGVDASPPAPVTASPSAIALGTMAEGGAAVAAAVTLRNNTTNPISLYSVTPSAGLGDLAVTSDPTPMLLLSGATVEVAVAYDPQTAGAVSGTLDVEHYGPGTPLQVPVTGTVVGEDAPTEVGGLRVTAVGADFASLAWDPFPDATGYILRYGTTQGGPYPSEVEIPLASLSNPATPTWTVSGLAAGTYYLVVDTAAGGAESAEVSAVVAGAAEVPDEDAVAQGAAAVIGRATIASGDDSVTVTPDAAGFNEESVQATPVGLPEALWAVTSVTATTFDIELAATATRDNAFNWAVHPGLPAPSGLTVDESGVDETDGAYIDLTWEAVTAADGYHIDFDDDASGAPYDERVTVTVAEVTDNLDGTVSYRLTAADGLVEDVEYFVVVAAWREV